MNKTALLTSTFAAASLLACAVDQPETSTNQGLSFEEFKAKTSREKGTGAYVLDFDMVIHSEAALYEYWERTQQGALSVYSQGGTDHVWPAAQKKNITYCIGQSFGAQRAQIVAAMDAATVNGWEKFADVKFVHVAAQDANCNANNNNVVFDVNLVSGQPYLARAFFPNSPRIERNVLVDTTAFDPNSTGGISLANIMVHELGHTLGFRHEHIRPEAGAPQCQEDADFRGVTAYDKASTMHYPQCNGAPGATLALSPMDKTGASTVYGPPGAPNVAPMASLASPADNATVLPNFTVDASIVDTDLQKVDLYIDDVLTDTATTAPFLFEVQGLSLGAHTVKVVATDGAGQTAQSVARITVANGGPGSGTGTGGGNGTGDGSSDITGGCNTSGTGSSILFALGLIGLLRRRR